MHITEMNLAAAWRGILERPEEERDALFLDRIMTPLRPIWEPMLRFRPPTGGESPALAAARMMKLYLPEMGRERALEALGQLEEARVWEDNLTALRRSASALDTGNSSIETVRLVLTLADPDGLGEEGYTGAGNTPGWVMVSVWPNAHNLPKLPAVTAHEFNHNVRFARPDWTFPITLGAYLVAEGLAESFAAELYGPGSLGPWTTTLGLEALRGLWPRYQAALEEREFGVVRGYIFGDGVMERYGQPGTLGLPDYAGYALGYRVVQDYLARTGRTAAQATSDPWRQIVEESGWLTR